MSLRGAPLLYVFYETSSLPHQRELCERILGFRVIENQFHPPHEYHGLVKYDGGPIILSLNLTTEGRFRRIGSDALITVLCVDRKETVLSRLQEHGYTPPKTSAGLFTDAYGHHYLFRNAPSRSTAKDELHPRVEELRLTVSDLSSSLTFYKEVLGLELIEHTGSQARFSTGSLDLVAQCGTTAPDGRPVRHNTYLLVFYTEDIIEARDSLVRRGLSRTPLVGHSDIGQTARFRDPAGHVYCLYQPSEESLTWGSGPKVKEIVANSSDKRLTALEVSKAC